MELQRTLRDDPFMQRFTLNPSTPIEFDFDPDARIGNCPRSYTTKGMFFSKFVALLGSDWSQLEPHLDVPVKAGRYLPFRDYPVRDYMRLMAATARKRYPQLKFAEGCRQVSRRNMEEFAGSTLGSIMLSLIGSVDSALAKLPSAYRQVMNSGHVSVTPIAEGGARIEYRDYRGWLDCSEIGVIEGIVMHYKKSPTITATLQSDHAGVYEVRW